MADQEDLTQRRIETYAFNAGSMEALLFDIWALASRMAAPSPAGTLHDHNANWLQLANRVEVMSTHLLPMPKSVGDPEVNWLFASLYGIRK